MSRTEMHRLGPAARGCCVAQLTLFLWFLHYSHSVSAQKGFLSIDCGSQTNTTYIGLRWQIDEPFVEGGRIGSVQTDISSIPGHLHTLRFFPPDPDYKKFATSCYRVPVDSTERYLVRASFLYGNYDNKSSPPRFELGVGLAQVATVQTTLDGSQEYEVILMPKSSDLLVCLNQLETESVPFISSLEVRQLRNSMYTKATQTTSLIKVLRVNFGSTATRPLRWPDDDFDRIWQPDTVVILSNQSSLQSFLTDDEVNSSADAPDQPPDVVMRTAVGFNSSREAIYLDVPYSSNASVPYIAAYFSNIIDASDSLRIISVHLNDILGGTVQTQPLVVTELVMNDLLPESSGPLGLNISPTSSNIAFINGLEVYTTSYTVGTDILDWNALKTVQGTFPQLAGYFGDPCLPFTWDWIDCTERASEGEPLRITAIYLSSRNLTGVIPAAIADLNLKHLWLDDNELQGLIPDLSSAQNLQTLHLQNNRLSGPLRPQLALLQLKELYVQKNSLNGIIPQELLDKVPVGLDLRIEGNSNLCFSNGTCASTTPLGSLESLPTNEPPKESSKSSSVLVIVGGVVGAALALTVFLCILVYCCCFKKNCKRGMDLEFDRQSSKACFLGCLQRCGCSKCFRTKPRQVSHLNSVGVNISKATQNGLHPTNRGTSETSIYVAMTDAFREAQTFRPVDIKKATGNHASKIGEGGFGPVYYGRLSNNMEVAVKVRSNHSRQGAREFATEVEILSRAKHPNLVALIGHCQETKDYMLIYEYLSGGTLQEHLYGVQSERPLDWKTRLKIAVDSAKGLEFLHNDCFPTIIHRDVKSSNILLTANFDAKVADFGLSKFVEGQAVHVSTLVKGTSGYLDPEYFESQRLTHKSDVYSFGIVLLEIITAREPLNTNLDRDQWRLSDWTRKHLLKGDLEKVVDPKLKENYNVQSMWKVAELAMTCVEPRSIHRPTMNEVVTELQSAVEIEAEGHTMLTLPIAYNREDPYLLEPGRQYHSQSFGRHSNVPTKLPWSLSPSL